MFKPNQSCLCIFRYYSQNCHCFPNWVFRYTLLHSNFPLKYQNTPSSSNLYSLQNNWALGPYFEPLTYFLKLIFGKLKSFSKKFVRVISLHLIKKNQWYCQQLPAGYSFTCGLPNISGQKTQNVYDVTWVRLSQYVWSWTHGSSARVCLHKMNFCFFGLAAANIHLPQQNKSAVHLSIGSFRLLFLLFIWFDL